MISKAMLAEMLPRWDRTVRAIHADLQADRDLGWAQEMFAFSLALANRPTGPPAVRLRFEWMVQPPFECQQALLVDPCKVRASLVTVPPCLPSVWRERERERELSALALQMPRYRSDPTSDRLNTPLCIHTPVAERLVNVSIIHYTYGQDVDPSGRSTYGRVGEWHWDKRDWGACYPPLPLKPPPPGTGQATTRLIAEVEAAGSSPRWRQWWAANSRCPP